MQVVDREQLAALAAARPSSPPDERRGFDPDRNGHTEFSLEEWIDHHNVPVRREGSWGQGGYRWVLEVCPWNGHTDNSAYIEQLANRGRRIRLTPEAVDALKRHRIEQNEERLRRGSLWRDHGLVFCSTVGTPMNPDNFIKRSYKPLLERTGLPQIPFHCLRHTFATLMMPNEHPKVVQEMLGHARISTTLDVYSHVSPDMQDDAVKRFGSLFS